LYVKELTTKHQALYFADNQFITCVRAKAVRGKKITNYCLDTLVKKHLQLEITGFTTIQL
jgi:hypothetical protein